MASPPSRGARGSGFGMRSHPIDGTYRMHFGEDGIGKGNFAPVTGTVVFAGWDSTGHGFGWCVGVREAKAPDVIWWVAHFGTSTRVNPLLVEVGDAVEEAETFLGESGTTGAAKGKHAHTERRERGRAVPGSGIASDPRPRYTTTAGGGAKPFPATSNEEDDSMNIRVIAHFEGGKTQEVALICPQFKNGYTLAKPDTATAIGWLRMYSPTRDGLPHNRFDKDQYLGAIEAARASAAAYQAGYSPRPADTSTDPAVAIALADLAAAVRALPKEIDEYADGKKQS